jgi:hypothetical protein
VLLLLAHTTLARLYDYSYEPTNSPLRYARNARVDAALALVGTYEVSSVAPSPPSPSL